MNHQEYEKLKSQRNKTVQDLYKNDNHKIIYNKETKTLTLSSFQAMECIFRYKGNLPFKGIESLTSLYNGTNDDILNEVENINFTSDVKTLTFPLYKEVFTNLKRIYISDNIELLEPFKQYHFNNKDIEIIKLKDKSKNR